MSNSKKKKKKMKTWKKLVLFLAELVLLAVVIVVWFVVEKFSELDIVTIDRESIVVNEEIYEKNTVMQEYTNILLLGCDERSPEVAEREDVYQTNTDAILVCSINNNTKEVKLVSVYRDTILLMPKSVAMNEKYVKATEAYNLAGVETTIGMINTNLDLDIKDYVLVNFAALIDIVDAVGGIDLEIDDNELYWINEYLRDTAENTGRTYELVESSGMVHLDGIQATSYCRIRYDKNLDYGRAERQRKVISLVFERAKKMNVSQLSAAVNGVIANVKTSIPASQILSMAQDVFNYNLSGQCGFPFEKYGALKSIGEINIVDPVMADNLAANVTELHKYLFDLDNYVPTNKLQENSTYLQYLLETNKAKKGNVYE